MPRISELNPTAFPTLEAEFPVSHDGETNRYSLDQVRGMFEYTAAEITFNEISVEAALLMLASEKADQSDVDEALLALAELIDETVVRAEEQEFSPEEQAQIRANIGANFLGGFRNLLINALGTVNQRDYTSGAATSGANQYTVDRWRVVTSGQNLSWTSPDGIARLFTAPAGGVEQVVEGPIESGDYVLNWGGTAAATVNGSAVSKGVAFALNGAGASFTVRFFSSTFSRPQLERGVSPTDFEVRHPGQELALCQRYYQTRSRLDLTRINTSDTSKSVMWEYAVRMRATPTIVIGTNTGGGDVSTTTSADAVRLSSSNAASTTAFVAALSADAEL